MCFLFNLGIIPLFVLVILPLWILNLIINCYAGLGSYFMNPKEKRNLKQEWKSAWEHEWLFI